MTHAADVLIVGAGPAGATAARTLARAGIRTLVLDRVRFPRTKPCGGAITTRALARFPHLPSLLETIPTHWISALDLEAPDGTVVRLRSARPAVFLIRRIEFDAALVRAATESGATLVEGADVCDVKEHSDSMEVATRDGRRFRSAMVVAADGVHGVVARRLGLFGGWTRDALAVDLMEEAPSTQLTAIHDDTLWVAYGHQTRSGSSHAPLHRGYAYVFPKAGHTNVGIGYLASDYRDAAPGRAYDLYQGLVTQLNDRGILRGDSARARFTPYLIPARGPISRTATARALVAGDAGGFVNAFTAEGIYYAMVSGELAARACVARLRNNQDAGRTYARLWRRAVGAELRDSVAIQELLFARPGRIDRMVQRVPQERSLTNAVIDCAEGSRTYAELRRTLVRRNPLVGLFLAGLTLKHEIM